MLTDVLASGRVIRGWLGVEPQTMSPQLAQALGITDTRGVLISGLLRNGPAHRAGVMPGDVIVAIGDTEVNSPRELMDRIAAEKPGSKVALRLQRKKETLTLDTEVAERPANGSGMGD